MVVYGVYPGVFDIMFWTVAGIALGGAVGAIVIASLSITNKLHLFDDYIDSSKNRTSDG